MLAAAEMVELDCVEKRHR